MACMVPLTPLMALMLQLWLSPSARIPMYRRTLLLDTRMARTPSNCLMFGAAVIVLMTPLCALELMVLLTSSELDPNVRNSELMTSIRLITRLFNVLKTLLLSRTVRLTLRFVNVKLTKVSALLTTIEVSLVDPACS